MENNINFDGVNMMKTLCDYIILRLHFPLKRISKTIFDFSYWHVECYRVKAFLECLRFISVTAEKRALELLLFIQTFLEHFSRTLLYQYFFPLNMQYGLKTFHLVTPLI